MFNLKEKWKKADNFTKASIITLGLGLPTMAFHKTTVTAEDIDAQIARNGEAYASFCADHPQGSLGHTPIPGINIWPSAQPIAPWSTPEQCIRSQGFDSATMEPASALSFLGGLGLLSASVACGGLGVIKRRLDSELKKIQPGVELL